MALAKGKDFQKYPEQKRTEKLLEGRVCVMLSLLLLLLLLFPNVATYPERSKGSVHGCWMLKKNQSYSIVLYLPQHRLFQMKSWVGISV